MDSTLIAIVIALDTAVLHLKVQIHNLRFFWIYITWIFFLLDLDCEALATMTHSSLPCLDFWNLT